MPSISIPAVLQVIVGLGLLNVWLLRSASATAYRGGAATTLKEEFAAYGLPDAARYVVGALKVGDAPRKFLPAALMLLMCLAIVVLRPA